MIILFFILNFAVSWFNAWSCGRSWNETKHVGGILHFINWCGAIMSAAGFTWCYMVLAVTLGSVIPLEQDDGTMAPMLTPEMADMVANLGFIIVYFPIVGSGIVITLQAWAAAWQRRTLGNMAVAGYDTFAMAYNIHQGLTHLPNAFNKVGSFFGGGDSDKDKSLVLLLVAFAALGGMLTTYTIVTKTAARVRSEARWKFEAAKG